MILCRSFVFPLLVKTVSDFNQAPAANAGSRAVGTIATYTVKVAAFENKKPNC
ncbi:hypothetical protein SAMN06265218_10653 [Fodinibius sediminis]|uniref:Uncharacterized protein n=1 Tax=Fodinibius sediminis TaxID=1214077 RepID=A0A521CIF3_9BACT|nr:hypothetical protein SAMN06265218_10653 [Fodinibius sediminis]